MSAPSPLGNPIDFQADDSLAEAATDRLRADELDDSRSIWTERKGRIVEGIEARFGVAPVPRIAEEIFGRQCSSG